jgi:serine/threonine-protein kinase
MSYNIGDRIGDYEVAGVLGAGGMGRVYKVRNVISDRVEAMKVLLPDLANVPELADRFMREIKVLAGLEHPNIAALRTAQRIDNQLVMVMELVEGQTLEDRLKAGPIPVAEAMDYVTQVLSALSYAHERGVIHRDIKPANMMVTEGGVVKLMDFGIAKAAGDRRLTLTGTTMGSLYYMSPEQIKGAELDARSDLYSLGVSLYEMVTGARPFRGESDFSIMSAHLEKQPVPPIEVDPKLPAALNEIIMMAIAKDPAQRFQSASAFQKAVKTLVGGRPAQAAGAVGPPPVQAAPPAVAPPPVQPAPAWQAPAMQPPPARSSHRGLYMALGAVLGIAVLILGATQLPKWLKTRAGETPAAVQETSPPEATPPEPPPAPAEAAAEAQPAQSGPAASATAPSQPAPSGSGAPAPPSSQPGASSAAKSAAPSSRSRGAGASQAQPSQAGAAEPETPAQPQPPRQQRAAPGQSAQDAAAADAAKTAALREIQKNWRMLASRAGAVSGSLQNLQQQQQRSGMGLRGDIAASWKRMEYDMDQLEAAISAKDPEAAKEHMENAEREITNLEKFLGR